MSDSDRQALRLAQDLREEMRAALPHAPTEPSVSPFVDQTGTPSVLLRLDADTARALMALLAERRLDRGAAPGAAPAGEPHWGGGTHVPPSVPPPAAQGVPAAQGPVVAAVSPFGEPAYADPAYAEPSYAESPFIPPQQGTSVFVGGTGPTPLVPSPIYPAR
ncbi:hypothetical protein E1264_37980 [Actinomadura sp. KC216]|uniref:hypothetical protein n=1 Tax=Actinomadura sp. KC216 TaxID=2530370 RepID=UPI001045573E|nr:hypothetical protein [Actinomadura sp. KC216]TDB76811.1 hypothetical protein E1264_37980 [Actinomadura sp. KC216]